MEANGGISRHVVGQLFEALADTPVVYLQGARQTGKSTLAQSLGQPRRPFAYLTLDAAAAHAAATEDPHGFVAGLATPTVIDEVQRVPDLALAIKAAVDQERRPGRFLLTGSASVLAFPQLADALAGRMELHTLWPFSQGELAGVRETFIDRLFKAQLDMPTAQALDENDLIDRIRTGGYPEIHARASARRRQAWFVAYMDAILQRDVRELANVERLADMPRLLALAASRTSQLLNFADLARTIAAPQTTLKRYLALLQATFMVRLLPAWSANLGKRLAKAPKIMLTDTGLLAHLVEADAARFKRDRMLLGHVLENFVAMELTKQLGWCEKRCRLFHFRTDSGAEVDLVLEDQSGGIVGLEVKSKASLRGDDFAGLRTLAAAVGDRFVRGTVLYTGAEVVPFGPNLHALPIAQLWA